MPYLHVRPLLAILLVWLSFQLQASETDSAGLKGPPLVESPLPIDEAATVQKEDDREEEEAEELSLDVESSIDDFKEVPEETPTTALLGWHLRGDLRSAYSYSDLDDRDGSSDDEDVFGVRARFGAEWRMAPGLRTVIRAAGVCSTNDCSPDLILEETIPTSNGIDDGDATLDQFFVHWFRSNRFDAAIGRMQTKFVTRGGVFNKSLDRNDSHNIRVNWTDGFHGTLRGPSGWIGNLILQRNPDGGTTNVRRSPLDFDNGDSDVTAFVALENRRPLGLLVQRAIDVSYLPDSLLKDGTRSGRREDYWGIVGRMAARWPARDSGTRMRVSGELGYAPKTPTQAAMELRASDDDVDGLAWAVTASLMEFLPHHSIGINVASTDPGWLLSPQYRENENLYELRYQWRRSSQLAFEVRGRLRKERDKQTTAERKRETFDVFLRLTLGFSVDRRR